MAIWIIAKAISPGSQQREAGTGFRASGTELGIKGLGLPEGMARVQIRPSVSEYQELLYVCLHEYEQQRRQDKAGAS